MKAFWKALLGDFFQGKDQKPFGSERFVGMLAFLGHRP